VTTDRTPPPGAPAPATPARAGRSRLTAAERRSEIIAAAQSVFAASGLAGARTSTIADAAGVAESMLYRHFTSKQELFEVAVVEPVADFVEGVISGADGLLDWDGPGSRAFYESFLETMAAVLPLLGVALFSDAREGRRFYNDKIVPLFDRYEDKVGVALDGMPGHGVSAAFLSRAVIGIIFLITLDAAYREPAGALNPDDTVHTAEAVRSFVAAALGGSGADDLLDILAGIEAMRRPGDGPPAAKPPVVSEESWAHYWAARAAAARRRDEHSHHVEAENQTLRRIVSDQAIELERLRSARAQVLPDQPSAPV
jgi:AcrR family transcriptional regulator